MTVVSDRPTVILYRRPDCALCDDARAELQAILEERVRAGEPVTTMREVDITRDATLEERFGSSVPVLAIGDRRLDLATGARRIRAFLDGSVGRLA